MIMSSSALNFDNPCRLSHHVLQMEARPLDAKIFGRVLDGKVICLCLCVVSMLPSCVACEIIGLCYHAYIIFMLCGIVPYIP